MLPFADGHHCTHRRGLCRSIHIETLTPCLRKGQHARAQR